MSVNHQDSLAVPAPLIGHGFGEDSSVEVSVTLLSGLEARSMSKLRVGTDFSGIEGPCCALRGLGVKFELVFALEIKPKLRSLLRSEFKPKRLDKD